MVHLVIIYGRVSAERLGDSMKLYRPIYEANDPGDMSDSQIIKVLDDSESW